MNDDELITLIQAQRDKVALNVPVEEIMRRGRTMHTRRLVPGLAGGLAVGGAGVALALTALTPAIQNTNHQTASHSAGRQITADLAGFTVTEQADGSISVTIRQLQDPAQLQSTLRADGVPASVTFAEKLNSACQPYPGGTSSPPRQISPLLKAVFPEPYQNLANRPLPSVASVRPADHAPGRPVVNPQHTLIVIDRSALPSNAGVQLATSSSGTVFMLPQVVYASSQCTGT